MAALPACRALIAGVAIASGHQAVHTYGVQDHREPALAARPLDVTLISLQPASAFAVVRVHVVRLVHEYNNVPTERLQLERRFELENELPRLA